MLTKDRLISMTPPGSSLGMADTVLICAMTLELLFSVLSFLPYAIDCVQIEIKIHDGNMLNFCSLVFKIELCIIPIEMLQCICHFFLV